MLEMTLQQKQSYLVSVSVGDLHFACTSEIKSPPVDVAALLKGVMTTSSVYADLSIARLPAWEDQLRALVNTHLPAPISVEIPIETPSSHIVKLPGLKCVFQAYIQT